MASRGYHIPDSEAPFYDYQICEGYGLTESSPVSHINPFGGKTKVGTIGLPIPNTEAKLVDVDDPDIEIDRPGQPGELCIKGPQVMRGYVGLPDQTAAALRDGWLLTGDIATVDDEGYFTLVDRKKDLIIAQGSIIYPRDVDEVLFSHPKILEGCAIGVPDSTGGEMVKAFVALKKGQKATQEEIMDYCSRNLDPLQVPKQVDFVDQLPRSPVGKILRKELRRQHLLKRPPIISK
jgi:long-chain acyl-CoA synthetase